jgi:aspartate kinase
MHTVEKIGGTSMSEFGTVLDNLILGKRPASQWYNRIFVVSAYGGITNLLLEHKKSGEPGIYARYAAGDPAWVDTLERTKATMCTINAGFAGLGLHVAEADRFVRERLDGIRDCLKDLMRVVSYGHFALAQQLPAVREMLAAVGEAHSAWNSVDILRGRGVNAQLVDLSGWRDTEHLPFDEVIRQAFEGLDLAACMPIVTGYTKCAEGIMATFDRGYSEITFSKIAVITRAAEGVIHKEFHLSSGDPKLIGKDRVRIIGHTNYDVADQLADLGMEAIHPKASKGMERLQIPIRVKNAFEPEHPGTLIRHDYQSVNPRVEMITGRKNLMAVELVDPDMVGQVGYDHRILKHLADWEISYVAKNTNANTITHYIGAEETNLDKCLAALRADFPGATIRTLKVAIVCAIGSNMKVPGFMSKAARALADAGINILAVDQCMRQVNMQFIVAEKDFDAAVVALHRGLVEGVPEG